ncbi:Protein PAT1-like 1 [Gryllus bimaculatus]|nr:Protein PAT1-like 1 [Gryllus bimaculatus]
MQSITSFCYTVGKASEPGVSSGGSVWGCDRWVPEKSRENHVHRSARFVFLYLDVNWPPPLKSRGHIALGRPPEIGDRSSAVGPGKAGAGRNAVKWDGLKRFVPDIVGSERVDPELVGPEQMGPEGVGLEGVRSEGTGSERDGPQRVDPQRVDPQRVDPQRVDPQRVDPQRVDPQRVIDLPQRVDRRRVAMVRGRVVEPGSR